MCASASTLVQMTAVGNPPRRPRSPDTQEAGFAPGSASCGPSLPTGVGGAVEHSSSRYDLPSVGYVSQAQGSYYLLSGVWPIVSAPSFQRVTGPKQDMWLAQTVGALIAVIGGVLLIPSKDERSRRLLAVGSAVALGAVDFIFVSRGRIRPLYLVDAAIEAGFVTAHFWPTTCRGGTQLH